MRGAEPLLAQLAVDLEEVVLRLLDEDQCAGQKRMICRQISDPMLPPGPGDEDRLAGEETLQFGRVEVDRLSSEQISDVYRAAGRHESGQSTKAQR